MSSSRIKTGDTVVIRTGKDKGKSGKVVSVDLDNQRIVVEGINVAKRHRKPTLNSSAGGIEQINRPISISNVGVADSKNKPSRIAYKIDSKGKKTRVFAGTDKEIK